MFNKLKKLKENGYCPDIVLDIGAHVGSWTKDCQKIFKPCTYYQFEAIDYNELKQFGKNAFIVLLNDENKDVDWYEMKNTGDSMFKELNKVYNNCLPVKRQSYKLDHIVEQNSLIPSSTQSILIKIDCQGAEIPILKGASEVIKKTDFIILEIPFFGQYNTNVPNFLEHIQFMDDIGFIVYDIMEEHNVNNFNMQVDILFIKKDHQFNSTVKERLN